MSVLELGVRRNEGLDLGLSDLLQHPTRSRPQYFEQRIVDDARGWARRPNNDIFLHGMSSFGDLEHHRRRPSAHPQTLAIAYPAVLDIISARITADFEFQASEQYDAAASLGVAVDVVTVSAGYSALYKSTSTSKIHLEVEFVSVNYAL